MKRKSIVLAALLVSCGLCEYFVFAKPPLPRQPAPNAAIALALPQSIGSLRSIRRWRDPWGGGMVEMGASYRGPSGVEANVDVRLDAGGPHNSVACWLVEGYPMLWQRLLTVRTATGTAVFDAAAFRDNRRLALLANTECYASGCREIRVPTAFGFELPALSRPVPSAVPVSILLTQPEDPPSGRGQAGSRRLVESFRGFVSHWDLGKLFGAELQSGGRDLRPGR